MCSPVNVSSLHHGFLRSSFIVMGYMSLSVTFNMFSLFFSDAYGKEVGTCSLRSRHSALGGFRNNSPCATFTFSAESK